MTSRQRLRTRNRKVDDILGEAYEHTTDPALEAERALIRKHRAEAARSRLAKWVQCSIRGCREKALSTDTAVICDEHAVTIWEMVERRDSDPFLREHLSHVIEKRNRLRAETREMLDLDARRELSKPDSQGDIYYAKVGSLIKVGWSSNLYERIRSYGADCVLLAHYPGTRQDETNLHRQLTPSRAKGREWYTDDAIIRAFIALVIRQYGEPVFTDTGWTKPKQIVAGKRH